MVLCFSGHYVPACDSNDFRITFAHCTVSKCVIRSQINSLAKLFTSWCALLPFYFSAEYAILCIDVWFRRWPHGWTCCNYIITWYWDCFSFQCYQISFHGEHAPALPVIEYSGNLLACHWLRKVESWGMIPYFEALSKVFHESNVWGLMSGFSDFMYNDDLWMIQTSLDTSCVITFSIGSKCLATVQLFHHKQPHRHQYLSWKDMIFNHYTTTTKNSTTHLLPTDMLR